MKADERRYTPRYKLKIPLIVQLLGASMAPAQSFESANVSARGVYFASDLPFQIGTPLQISFRMPEEVTGRISPEWNCRGRVVRIDAGAEPSGMAGIGVELQYYEISQPLDRQELNH
jgi:PilZ domain